MALAQQQEEENDNGADWEALAEPENPAPAHEEEEEEPEDWEAGLMADGTSLAESSALSSWSEEDVRNALRLAMMTKDAPAMEAAVQAATHLGMLHEVSSSHPSTPPT